MKAEFFGISSSVANAGASGLACGAAEGFAVGNPGRLTSTGAFLSCAKGGLRCKIKFDYRGFLSE
jgi:hypothetical protein